MCLFVAWFANRDSTSQYPFESITLFIQGRDLGRRLPNGLYSFGDKNNIFSVRLPEHIFDHALGIHFCVAFGYIHILINYSAQVGYENRM